jgi:antirestriction protein ArdC
MTEKLDVYSRVTGNIIADLERGNLTWLQPWQAGHQAGPVSRPLRAAGKAYRCRFLKFVKYPISVYFYRMICNACSRS